MVAYEKTLEHSGNKFPSLTLRNFPLLSHPFDWLNADPFLNFSSLSTFAFHRGIEERKKIIRLESSNAISTVNKKIKGPRKFCGIVDETVCVLFVHHNGCPQKFDVIRIPLRTILRSEQCCDKSYDYVNSWVMQIFTQCLFV